MEIYGPLVYGYCRRSLLQESDAADVSQEVMMRVSQALRRFEYDPARGSFRHWLGRVARNEVARFCEREERIAKGKRLWRALPSNSTVSPVRMCGTNTFTARCWRRRSGGSNPRSKRRPGAFQAVWIDNLPPEAASQQLGMPVEKIYVAKSRVLKRLREELLVLCEDIPNASRM